LTIAKAAILLVVALYFHEARSDDRADLQLQLKHLAQELQKCQQGISSDVFDMKLHFLDKNTTCNDGSPAG